jgi:hypothetical protein
VTKKIRIKSKRVDEIDLDRLVHALLALAEDLAEPIEADEANGVEERKA